LPSLLDDRIAMKTEMYGYYTASASAKLDEFISVVSVCLDNQQIGRELEWIFRRCTVRHVVSKHATVRQCFILTYPVRNPETDDFNPFTLVAIAYVQLRNGQLYGLELTGNVERGLDKINAIGAWLNEQRYEQARFTAYETYLARMINCADSEREACELNIFRYAPIGPCVSFLQTGMNKICVAILGLAPGKCNAYTVEQISQAVATSFPQFSCAENLIASFARNLDLPVIHLLGELNAQFGPHLLSLDAYNYLVAGDPIRKRNRLQALRELPWLTPLLIHIGREKWKFSALTLAMPDVRSAKRLYWARALSTLIDGGQALFTNVAAIFKVNRNIIKWSKHLPLYQSTFFTPERTEQMLVLLGAIRHGIRPKNAKDWGALEAILVALARFALPFHGDQHPIFKFTSDQETLADVFARPQMQEILLQRLSELGQRNVSLQASKLWLGEHLSEVGDFFDALRAALRWHCYDYPDSHGKSANHVFIFVDEWLRTQTLQQIVQLSDDWHAAIHRELERVIAEKHGSGQSDLDLAIGSEWPLILQEPRTLENYKFTELPNEAELIKEGRLMKHCVGSYGEKCAQGNTLIFSVADQGDMKLATLELAICEETGRISLVSHKGIRNANPSEECQEAALAFVNHLNAEAFAICIKNRQCFQKSRRAISAEINQMKMTRKNHYQRMTQRVAWQCCFGAV
jgi:hypothetical protein